jgi:hypothetical protein
MSFDRALLLAVWRCSSLRPADVLRGVRTHDHDHRIQSQINGNANSIWSMASSYLFGLVSSGLTH